MRIAFIGAQCSGKSTTAALLSVKLGLPLLTGVARGVAKTLGIEKDEGIDMDTRYIFQVGIMVSQLQKEAALHSFVSDRGVIDNLVYLDILARQPFSPVPDTYESFWTPILKKAFYEYDYVFWLDPIPPHSDGFRNTDRIYQQQVHDRIGEVLQEWEATGRVFRVLLKPLEERVDMIYSQIIRS